MSARSSAAATTTLALPAAVARGLLDWRRRLQQVELARRLFSPQADQLQRDLWGEVAHAVLSAGDEEAIAQLLPAVARRLRISPASLSRVLEVGRAWPQEIPERPWIVLCALARLPQEERDRLDAALPLDAPLSAVTSPAQKADGDA